MATQQDFTTIDRPYNSFLERSDLTSGSDPVAGTGDDPTGADETSSTSNVSSGQASSGSTVGNVETQPVKSDGGMSDLWIKNFIRSENWKPRKVGFYMNGLTGYAEFAKVYISGEIEALSGLIGGFTIGATTLSVTNGINTTIISSGATAFAAGPTGSPTVTITQAGALTATSGAIGGWTIATTTLSATGITLDAGNQKITVGAASPITIDGVAKEIRSANYVSGVSGAGFHLDSNLLEVGNISARGLIRTAVFQKGVVSAVGGSLAVLDSDMLDADMTALDSSTLTTKETTDFGVGDILRIKDGVDDEWLEVVSISSAPTYVVTRDKASVYGANTNPTWKKGATVVNYGVSGEGGVYMTASDTNAPYLSIFDHSGSPWTTLNTRLRIGNLNGYLGYTSNLYGIGIGDTDKYLKYDPISGLTVKGNITIGTTDSIKGGQTDFATGNGFFLGYSGDYKFSIGDADNYVTWDGVYLKIRGSFDVGSSGVINNAVYTVATLPIPPTSDGFNDPSGIE